MKLKFHKNVWWWVLTIIGWGLACIHWTNFKVLQWRNRLAHGTYRQYKELCRGCEFEPHLEQTIFVPFIDTIDLKLSNYKVYVW